MSREVPVPAGIDAETRQTVGVWRAYVAVIVTLGPCIVGAFAWTMPAKVREVVAVEVRPVQDKLSSYVETVRYEREQAMVQAMLQRLDVSDREARDRQETMHRELVDLIHALDKKLAELR